MTRYSCLSDHSVRLKVTRNNASRATTAESLVLTFCNMKLIFNDLEGTAGGALLSVLVGEHEATVE